MWVPKSEYVDDFDREYDRYNAYLVYLEDEGLEEHEFSYQEYSEMRAEELLADMVYDFNDGE